MFIPDKAVGYLILLVLPVIFRYFFVFKGKALIVFLILAIAFTSGCIEILSGFSGIASGQVLEFLIWGLAAYTFIESPKKEIPGWEYLAAFVCICIFSYAANSVTAIQLFLFIRVYLRIVAVFILFHHIRLDTRTSDKLLQFIILLFITQILVNMGRYPIVGTTEAYIGSMSVREGSLTTIFALVGISFSFSAYLHEKKLKYILLVLGLFIFSMIGSKRAMFIWGPLVLLTQYVLFGVQTRKISLKFLFKLVPVGIFALGFLYAGVRLQPSLNPEGQIGGSFDYDYLTTSITEYLNPGKTISGAAYDGRGEAPAAVYQLLTDNHGFKNLLFGLGPGDILESKWNTEGEELKNSSGIADDAGISGAKYGIGYGVRTGLLYTVMQVGLLGAVSYFLLITNLFAPVWRKFSHTYGATGKQQILQLGMTGAYCVFVFDFLFYSRVFTEYLQIVVPLAFVYNYLLPSRTTGASA